MYFKFMVRNHSESLLQQQAPGRVIILLLRNEIYSLAPVVFPYAYECKICFILKLNLYLQ